MDVTAASREPSGCHVSAVTAPSGCAAAGCAASVAARSVVAATGDTSSTDSDGCCRVSWPFACASATPTPPGWNAAAVAASFKGKGGGRVEPHRAGRKRQRQGRAGSQRQGGLPFSWRAPPRSPVSQSSEPNGPAPPPTPHPHCGLLDQGLPGRPHVGAAAAPPAATCHPAGPSGRCRLQGASLRAFCSEVGGSTAPPGGSHPPSATRRYSVAARPHPRSSARIRLELTRLNSARQGAPWATRGPVTRTRAARRLMGEGERLREPGIREARPRFAGCWVCCGDGGSSAPAGAAGSLITNTCDTRSGAHLQCRWLRGQGWRRAATCLKGAVRKQKRQGAPGA